MLLRDSFQTTKGLSHALHNECSEKDVGDHYKRSSIWRTSDFETAFLYLHDAHEQVSYRKEMFAKQYT